MTNEMPSISTTEIKQPIPFGTRLKTAREALGLKRKDAAEQLRLSERVIMMMEKDRYPQDLPVTFIRGYIKAYGKLLEIPDYEIKKAIEPIKPKAPQAPAASVVLKSKPVTSGNYYMQIFTYLIVFTLVALVGIWWYTHTATPPATTEASVNDNIMQSNNSVQAAVDPLPPTPNSTPIIINPPTISEIKKNMAEGRPETTNNVEKTELAKKTNRASVYEEALNDENNDDAD